MDDRIMDQEGWGAKIPWSIPLSRNIGLIITYKCPIECAHCLVDAGPSRTEEISLRDAFDWIRQISEYRGRYVKILSLTGGEPFYNLDKLNRISSYAEKRGLLISVATNAFWAKTPRKAVETLHLLTGIKMITLSTDVYHMKFLPLERISNAISAAIDCDISYNINVCTSSETDTLYADIIHYLEKIAAKGSINTTITIPKGRATNMGEGSFYRTEKEPPQIPCSSCSSPVITPTGKVIACCGVIQVLESTNPLMLGSLRDKSLSSILDEAELNPILHILRLWGPDRLISMAKEAGLGSHLPKMYAKDSICYACFSLMSQIEIVEFLFQLSSDQELRDLITQSRSYYLGEGMAE